MNQILCCLTWRPEWADDIVSCAHGTFIISIDIAAGEEHFDKVSFRKLKRGTTLASNHWLLSKTQWYQINNSLDNIRLHQVNLGAVRLLSRQGSTMCGLHEA